MLKAIRRGKRRYVPVVVCNMSTRGNEVTMNASLEGIRDLRLRCDIRRAMMSPETRLNRKFSSLVLVRNKNTCFFIRPIGCNSGNLVNFFYEGGEVIMRIQGETLYLSKNIA